MAGKFDSNAFQTDSFETTEKVVNLPVNVYLQPGQVQPLLWRVNPRFTRFGLIAQFVQPTPVSAWAGMSRQLFFLGPVTYSQSYPWWHGYEP